MFTVWGRFDGNDYVDFIVTVFQSESDSPLRLFLRPNASTSSSLDSAPVR